jgi:A/G-specific adenine glycosylase
MVCPLDALCVARRDGDPERYPVRTRKLKRTSESWWLLLAVDEGQRVWLERRPARGIWAGLYCLPVSANRADLLQQLPGGAALTVQDLPVFLHVLTHKDLHLHPVRCDGMVPADMALDEGVAGGWYTADQWQALGLPAPVRKLLEAQMPAAA